LKIAVIYLFLYTVALLIVSLVRLDTPTHTPRIHCVCSRYNEMVKKNTINKQKCYKGLTLKLMHNKKHLGQTNLLHFPTCCGPSGTPSGKTINFSLNCQSYRAVISLSRQTLYTPFKKNSLMLMYLIPNGNISVGIV